MLWLYQAPGSTCQEGQGIEQLEMLFVIFPRWSRFIHSFLVLRTVAQCHIYLPETSLSVRAEHHLRYYFGDHVYAIRDLDLLVKELRDIKAAARDAA